eukprot:TRINITY_DN1238_c0_g1_i2.p2 TRINITY_DN1238_c0_g1~~TRINITY_DN1238_c0_g1_i2.p2  ORF type:complete len:208 (+),score=41.90 TRINITY_DN1238_c0_g1_i2:740-1363(+)
MFANKAHTPNPDEECEPCDALGMFQKAGAFKEQQATKATPTKKANSSHNATPDTSSSHTSTPTVPQSSSHISESTPSKFDKEGFWEHADPPDTIELGRSTWTFLHTMAAYYPSHPTKKTQDEALSLLHSIPHLYPCKVCAADFKQIIATTPPKVENRQQISQWLCEAHNHVNAQLGKPAFDCTKVEQRWRRFIKDMGSATKDAETGH